MTISEATRRKIIYTIKYEKINWSGQIGEIEFLSRIYDLDLMPSCDSRFDDAKRDIYQHRIMNDDWPEDWVFDDERFNLLGCPDDTFLRFLCEMIHPAVRPNRDEAKILLDEFNDALKSEGYQIVEAKTRFGTIKYETIGILPNTIEALDQAKDIAEKLDSEYLQTQIVRMRTALDNDSELAIGTSKEFIESICKIILENNQIPLKGSEDLPKLVYMTLDSLKPLNGVSGNPEAFDLTRKTLGSLSTLVQTICELRNAYGTGHGKSGSLVISSEYASLAVNSAASIALFLYQLYEKGKK